MNLALPENRVAVKICGLTNEADALDAVRAGADLLGFNTWAGTPRHIDLEANAGWIAGLPVIRIALLVNAPLADAARVAAMPCVDGLQLHGDEDAAYCAAAAALGKPVIKAIRAGDVAACANASGFSTQHILLDALVAGAYGGTGARVDAAIVRQFQNENPNLTLWLAGGLKPENVAEAVKNFGPAVVDVSSGVEIGPGKKNFAKMSAFVTEARRSV